MVVCVYERRKTGGKSSGKIVMMSESTLALNARITINCNYFSVIIIPYYYDFNSRIFPISFS